MNISPFRIIFLKPKLVIITFITKIITLLNLLITFVFGRNEAYSFQSLIENDYLANSKKYKSRFI